MQLLLLHSDFIEYEALKKTPVAETVPPEQMKGRLEEVLAVFMAVEKVDETNPKGAASQAVSEIADVYGKVKAESIMLYPYAHLSPNLSKPDTAVAVMKAVETGLRQKGYTVKRAPFGFYKSFNIRCKGHPLSELSRRIIAGKKGETGEEAGESKALKAEKELKSSWHILDTKGELIDPKKFNFKPYKSLKIFYDYETKGTRTAEKEPPHVRLMKDMELVDYEPGSDSGNLRWYPKGSIIKRLLETHVNNLLSDYGVMQVETPIMYDFHHPALSKYLHRFPARQYTIKSDDKELFLRFSACFGQYLMKHDMTISYRALPLRLYELTHYSFRREQSGELSGLKRLRAFTMPDMHTLCADMDQARSEFIDQFKLSMQWMDDIGVEYGVAIRILKSFYDANLEFVQSLAALVDRPILIELWDERFFYFVMKFEFTINDALKKSSTLSTVQIDVENTERFDITYVDESGEKQSPLMLHASISGSIDRNLYAILEYQAMRSMKGEKPMLPVWLSPTQLRLIPVGDSHIQVCRDVLSELESQNIRVDIDDESETVGKKIRRAEKEWTPYIAVIGDREAESGDLTVRIRSEGGVQKTLSKEELIARIRAETAGKPYLPLPLNRLLSKRPQFR
ncbi:threonine--tRNA ligase 2 [archaeon BMS3Abin16]|nr:threonine--tRNA ligase 2 [archaeon BMS3Abin16]HDY74290.1 threonine--tRNA ligase [Euryarchaeota archaeon]